MADLTELRVETFGTGSPVVLLHSAGLSGRQWRRLALALSERGVRAVVPDLTGHGASPPWPEPRPFAFGRDVEQLRALLAALDAPAHLVGHSYGGFVALQAARDVPDRVRSLVLADPVAFGTLEPAADADARADLARVRFAWGASADAHEAWLRGFVEYWSGEGAWAALREDARAEFRRVGWVVREGARTLVEDTTPATAYGPITVPVTVISGERSPLAARRVVQRLAGSLRDARVVTVPGAGHMAPLTHADAVNAIVLDAIARADATLRAKAP